MSCTRGRVIPAQMKKLLDLLGEDGVLQHGKVMYTYTTKQCFWKRIATELNSVEGGVYKNTWKWCKVSNFSLILCCNRCIILILASYDSYIWSIKTS